MLNGTFKTMALHYLITVVLAVGIGWLTFQWVDRNTVIGAPSTEYTEYLSAQSERLGYIEDAIKGLAGLESEIRDIRRISERLESYNQESRDFTVGIGLISDENERIINELQRRATEAEGQ